MDAHIRPMHYTLPAEIDILKPPILPASHQECEEDIKLSQTPYTAAEIDHLTGLPNRYSFLKRMDVIRDCHLAKGTSACLLLVKSRKFDWLNRTYGYSTADTYFYIAAQRLISILDDVLLVSRFSAAEFAVIPKVHFANDEEAHIFCTVLASRIRDALDDVYRIDCASEQTANADSGFESLIFEGDFQIGMAFFGSIKEPLHHIFHRATMAVESNDHNGSKVCSMKYIDFDAGGHRKSLTLAKDLEAPNFATDLLQYYQLQVSPAGFIVGAECLVRWMHPRLGLLLPMDFIAIVEQSKAILALGYQMIELACQTLQRWAQSETTVNLRLSVNVSPRQFHDKQFLQTVVQILAKYNFHRAQLRFEITECIVIKDMFSIVALMEKLKAMGISISIDDFGTGYSSLSYIQRLPISEIKIDRSFVTDIENQPRSQSIVRTIMKMARDLNLEVVTEGIEKFSQIEYLSQVGESFYQGYFINKPMPLSEAESLIHHHHARPVAPQFAWLNLPPPRLS